MDDRSFDDPRTARDWIRTIEGPDARVRETDLYPMLREWIARTAPKRVLDVGCGQGACAAELGLAELEYVGVEPSPMLLERARERHAGPRRRFESGDVYRLPFADASFDAVFSISVWHLLAEPRRAAGEAARVLCPGGSLLLVTADPDHYDRWTEPYPVSDRDGARFTGRVLREDGTEAVDVLYLHPDAELREGLAEAGFRIAREIAFRNRHLALECVKERGGR